MNANMGVLPPEDGVKSRDKKTRYQNFAQRSKRDLDQWLPNLSRSIVGTSRELFEIAWE